MKQISSATINNSLRSYGVFPVQCERIQYRSIFNKELLNPISDQIIMLNIVVRRATETKFLNTNLI